MTTGLRAGVLAAALSVSGCAAHRFVVPGGAGEPAPEAAAILESATAACRGVRTYSARLHVPGIPGGLIGGVTAADEIYLNYTAPFGRPGFVLSGRAAEATLVLPGDGRFLTARADEIVDALIGLRLAPSALLALFDGCVSASVDRSVATRYADTLAVGGAHARVFLREARGAWQVTAGLVDNLLVHYRKFDRGWPRNIRVSSLAGAPVAIDMSIDLEDISINVDIAPAAFVARIPLNATRMTLDELKTLEEVTVRPFAKINLDLAVGPRRADGYHDVRTTLQSIALSDTVTITARPGEFELTVDTPGIPIGPANLVWRAAARLWAHAGRAGAPRDVRVDLTKRIPAAAGLGGGSSDAAATLVVLNHVWDLGVSRTDLSELAAQLGSDVPFFLEGGTASGVGRGEQLEWLPDTDPRDVILILPAFGVSTPDAYRWLDEDREAGQADTRGANDLQAPVVRRHPEIARMVAACVRAGALTAAMTGSGSAVFGLFPRGAGARAAAGLASDGWPVRQTHTLSGTQAKSQMRL